MSLVLPRVYPITDRKLSGLSHAEQVKALIEGGATFIQLREKELPGRDFFEDAKNALDIVRSANAKLLINDRVDLAIALGADGVHLGQNDLPPEEARKLLGDKAIIGFSTHNQKQALDALSMPIDYLAIGPVFATSTKSDPDPVVGLEGIRLAKDIVAGLPLVAIGGITEQTLRDVFSAGADSAAMIGDLVGSSDIAGTLKRSLSL